MEWNENNNNNNNNYIIVTLNKRRPIEKSLFKQAELILLVYKHTTM